MDTRLINMKTIKELLGKVFFQVWILFMFLLQVITDDVLIFELVIVFMEVGIVLFLYNRIYYVHLVSISEEYLRSNDKRKFSSWGKTETTINKINKLIEKSDVIYKNESNASIGIIDKAIENINLPVREIVNLSNLVRENNDNLIYIERKGYEVKAILEKLIMTSKLASGVEKFKLEDIDINFLIKQKILDYADEMKNRNLELISDVQEEELKYKLDGEKTSRALDIILSNVINFSQENTRVYLGLDNSEDNIKIVIKNISREKLNIPYYRLYNKKPKLNLEIAKGIVEGQKGSFSIIIDGDLFKVILVFCKDGVNYGSD